MVTHYSLGILEVIRNLKINDIFHHVLYKTYKNVTLVYFCSKLVTALSILYYCEEEEDIVL